MSETNCSPSSYSDGSKDIMNEIIHKAALAGLCLVCLALAGCSTANVNPPAPRAHTGYVDFYADADMGLCWEVKRADDQTGEMQVVFSEFKPVTRDYSTFGCASGKPSVSGVVH